MIYVNKKRSFNVIFKKIDFAFEFCLVIPEISKILLENDLDQKKEKDKNNSF